jgi:hypothetical protein
MLLLPVAAAPFLLTILLLGSQNHEEGVSQERQRHETIPGSERPHFVLIKPHFSFRLLISFFNFPP